MSSEKKPQQIIDMVGINRFGDRLEYVMNGESNRSFAKKCGLSETVIRYYLSGKTLPSLDKLEFIAKASGYSAEWLATGIDIENNAINKSQLSNKDLLDDLLGYLKRLDKSDLEIIINQIVNNGAKSLIINEQTQHARAITDLILSLNVEDQREILQLIQAKKLGAIVETIEKRKAG